MSSIIVFEQTMLQGGGFFLLPYNGSSEELGEGKISSRLVKEREQLIKSGHQDAKPASKVLAQKRVHPDHI